MKEHGIRDEFEAIDALNQEGVTVDRLCSLTGSSVPETRAELVGRRVLSDRTIDALRGLLAPHQAEEIASMVGSLRAAYLTEVQAGRL